MLYKKILLIISVLLLSACGSSNQVSATEILIDMNEFLYAPVEITIPVGQPVILTLTNSGAQEHDFVVEEIAVEDVSVTGNTAGDHHAHGESHGNYDLHVSTAIGGASTISFTATEPGTYKIFCSIQGHEVAGMVGKLIVVSE